MLLLPGFRNKSAAVAVPQRQLVFFSTSVLKTNRSAVAGLVWRDVMRREELVRPPPLPRSGATKGERALQEGSAKNRQPLFRN